jgi:hypothetical protein
MVQFPGSLVIPASETLVHIRNQLYRPSLTSVNVLGKALLVHTLQGHLGILGDELLAPVIFAASIERSLESIALPAKQVVAVLAVPGAVG